MRLASYRPEILYIGNEPMLSKASSSLLRTAGYRVRTTCPAHMAEAVRGGQYSAVILCATLTTQESEAVVGKLEEANLRIPIVSLQVGSLGDAPHPSSTAIVDALRGPKALVGAVQSVTQQRRKAC